MSSGGDIIRTVVPIAAAAAVMLIPGLQGVGLYLAMAAAATAASLAVNAMFPIDKPDLSFDYDFGDFNTEQTRVIRQAISFRRIIYGRCRVGGVYTFIESTKDAVAPAGGQVAGNTYLHMLITVAGHPVDGFEDIYIFDEVESFDPITHVSTGPNYANTAWCWTSNGASDDETQTVTGDTFALAVSDPGVWWYTLVSVADDFSGIQATYAAGATPATPSGYSPVVLARSKGDGSYTQTDAEIVTTYDKGNWTGLDASISGSVPNAALLVTDGSVPPQLLSALSAACPSTWTAAHKQSGCAKVYFRWKWDNNAYKAGLPQPSFIVRGKKVYDPRTATTAYSANAALCLRDYITSSLGLNAASTKLPDTEWSAEANICDEDVALAAGGTENRYECNGVVDLDTAPKKIIQALLTACAGRLVYTSGQWLLYAGAYRTPTITLTLDDLDGPIKIASRVSRRDLFNGVKGTYVDPDQAWQATDFPPVSVAAYVTEDQEEALWKDVAMAYTTSGSMAQRIARVELERGRRQITVNLSCKLSAYQCMTAETVMLTVPRYGWSAKVFEVMSWGFTLRTDGGEAPRLGIDLTLRETDSGVFSWTSAQEQTVNVAPRTNLPDPTYVESPTNLVVTESLYETRAGRGVAAKAALTWTASLDGFATGYEVEHRLVGGTWIADGQPRDASAEILDLAAGVYEFRVRARNNRGAASAWVMHTQQISGLSVAPSDPASLSVQIINNNVHASWPLSTDLDVRIGGKVWVRHNPATSGATWQNAFDIGPSVPGSATSVVLPALAGTYMIKFVDAVGTASDGFASAVTTVPSMIGLNIVETLDEAGGGFTGTKTNMYVDGAALKLAGGTNVDDIPDIDALPDFDAAGGVALSGEYNFSSGIDLGAVYTSRVTASLDFTVSQVGDTIDDRTDSMDSWADFDAYEITGMEAEIQVRTTDDDPSGTPTWSAWQRLVVGDYYCRAYEFKLVVTSDDASHQINVTVLGIQVDMPDKVQQGQGLTAAAGGTDVTYATPFKAVPALGITVSNAQAGDTVVITGEATTGFHIQVTNGGGGAERTFNYLAKGYF